MNTTQQPHEGIDTVCQICNEIHIFLQSFETSVVQGLRRLSEEREWAQHDQDDHEEQWAHIRQENIQRLHNTLQETTERLQQLQAQIMAATSDGK